MFTACTPTGTGVAVRVIGIFCAMDSSLSVKGYCDKGSWYPVSVKVFTVGERASFAGRFTRV